MAWPNPFRRWQKNSRSCWGYTFQLTDEHPTPEQLNPLKYSYDVLGEEALKRLDCVPVHSKSVIARKTLDELDKSQRDASTEPQSPEDMSVIVARRDLYLLLRDNADSDPVLGKLWREVHTVPHWVDWGRVARGQDVFYRYGGPALTGLAFQSLLGGMVRIINEVYSTRYSELIRPNRLQTEWWKCSRELLVAPPIMCALLF